MSYQRSNIRCASVLVLAVLAISCDSGESTSASESGASGSDAEASQAGAPSVGNGGASSGVAGASSTIAGAGLGATASAGAPSMGGADAVSTGGASAVAGPYANVVAVSVTGSAGAYVFAVSVESADVDCTQYANWWEVLSLDGELLYRRILEHSHTDANGTTDADAPGNTFTRTGSPVAIAEDEVVIVRAHMSVGGYSGAVMSGSVATGFTAMAEDAGSFALDVEALDPQPTGCAF